MINQQQLMVNPNEIRQYDQPRLIDVEALRNIPHEKILQLYREGYRLGNFQRPVNIQLGGGIKSLANCITTANVNQQIKFTVAINTPGTPPYTFYLTKGSAILNSFVGAATDTSHLFIQTETATGSYLYGGYVKDSCPQGAKTSPTDSCTINIVVPAGTGYNCVSNQCITPATGTGQYATIAACQAAGCGNGPCGSPTCYKCSGSSCIQDNVNGTFSTNNCNSSCSTGNGPCGQPTCYKCSGGTCVQDNVNGTFSTNNCGNTCVVNGPCGSPTCYKCSGGTCVQDNVNGTFSTSNCGNSCGTGNGPCGQPTCYKCSGGSCVQDNVNGTFSTSNCNSTCTSGGGMPPCPCTDSTMMCVPVLNKCIKKNYVYIGGAAGFILLVALLK